MDVMLYGDKTECIINLFDAVYNFSTHLLGEFNVSNVLATCTVCALIGVKTDQVIKSLEKVGCIDGRLQKIYDGDFSVFVDYAHTPDGLKKVLSTLKQICVNKVICVFGCGGNRDVDKRTQMGEISGEIADFTVITSDNPRFEEPMDIIHDIEKGVLKRTKNFVAIEDRIAGIEYALKFAKKGDVVLIAGKGAEKYQEVLGIKHPYNDKDTIEEILRRINH
jgi:UDP-N-acetylmuramoyl-L-alanyl-D-glutamate--2,6-diaminopimelate ligase